MNVSLKVFFVEILTLKEEWNERKCRMINSLDYSFALRTRNHQVEDLLNITYIWYFGPIKKKKKLCKKPETTLKNLNDLEEFRV